MNEIPMKVLLKQRTEYIYQPTSIQTLWEGPLRDIDKEYGGVPFIKEFIIKKMK